MQRNRIERKMNITDHWGKNRRNQWLVISIKIVLGKEEKLYLYLIVLNELA